MHDNNEYKIWALLLSCSLLVGGLLLLQETPLKKTDTAAAIAIDLQDIAPDPLPQQDKGSLASNNEQQLENTEKQNQTMRRLQREISAQLKRMQTLEQAPANTPSSSTQPAQETVEQPAQKAQPAKQYKGASSFIYLLKNRYIVEEFAPIYTCPHGGQISINIEVDRMGHILKAQISGTVGPDQACLAEQSLKNIYKNKFNKDLTAEKVQRGKIIFNFAGQR